MATGCTTLVFQDGSLEVETAMFTGLSRCFAAWLTLDTREKRESQVHLISWTRHLWRCVENFYSGDTTAVGTEHFLDIIRFSHMYELTSLLDFCSASCLSLCTVDNCLDVKRCGQLLDLHSVVADANRFIGEHFSEVCNSDIFLSFSKEDVLDLIHGKDVITTEDIFCSEILSWLSEKEADQSTVNEIFAGLRLEEMTLDFLHENLMSHLCVQNNQEILAMVDDEISRRRKYGDSSRFQPKLRKRGEKEILVVGIDLEKKTNRFDVPDVVVLYCWSKQTNRWFSLWEESEASLHLSTRNGLCSLSGMAILLVKGLLVFTGGKCSPRSTTVYNLGTRTWTTGEQLIDERHSHCMAAIASTLYVAGGYSNSSPGKFLSSLEAYKLSGNTWTSVGTLSKPLALCAMVALGRHLLLIGDVSFSGSSCLVQSFNVDTKTSWVLTELSPLPPHVRGMPFEDTAIFVAHGGQVIKVHFPGGVFGGVEYVQLEKCEGRWNVDFLCSENGVLEIGEEQEGRSGTSCWNLDGKAVARSDVRPLPWETFVSFSCELRHPLASHLHSHNTE